MAVYEGTKPLHVEDFYGHPDKWNTGWTMWFRPGQTGPHQGIRTVMTSLPEKPLMKPREADPRIGFWTFYPNMAGAESDLRYVGNAPGAWGNFDVFHKQIIARWNLPNCEPYCPLYHIDPSVPPEVRQLFKDGVEMWQPAFEAAGMPGWPKAVSPDDPDWPADYRLGDIDYPAVVLGVGAPDGLTSVATMLTDPRSGQILCSNVVMAQEWHAAFAYGLQSGISGSGMHPWDDTDRKNPERRRNLAFGAGRDDFLKFAVGAERLAANMSNDEVKTMLDGFARLALRLHEKRRRRLQEYRPYAPASGPVEIANLGGIAPGTPSNPGPEGQEFVQAWAEFMRYIVAHEVGHTLGLRHNFVGSLHYTMDQLSDPTTPTTSASVMDYVPLNIAPTAEKQGPYAPKTIGAYDMLAMKYAYSPGELGRDDLNAIAAELTAQGLQYQTDSAADYPSGVDSQNIRLCKAYRFDLSDDPTSWIKGVVASVKERLGLITHEFAKGEVEASPIFLKYLGMILTDTLGQLSKSATMMSRYVGCWQARSDAIWTPDEVRKPIEAMPINEQLEALQAMKDITYKMMPYIPAFTHPNGKTIASEEIRVSVEDDKVLPNMLGDDRLHRFVTAAHFNSLLSAKAATATQKFHPHYYPLITEIAMVALELMLGADRDSELPFAADRAVSTQWVDTHWPTFAIEYQAQMKMTSVDGKAWSTAFQDAGRFFSSKLNTLLGNNDALNAFFTRMAVPNASRPFLHSGLAFTAYLINPANLQD